MIKDLWPFVEQQGWSWEAMELFCQDQKIEIGPIKLDFPGGLDEILKAVNKELDLQVMAQIEKGLGVTTTLKQAIEYKIDFKLQHRNAFKKTMDYLLVPPRPLTSLKLAFETVNRFWYFAGDQSTDYNYYSKRLLLMYVYSPTMIYALTKNKTKDEIIHFMDKRFTEVALIPKIKQRIKSFI